MFNLYMLKKNLEYYLKIKIYLAKLSRYFVSDTLKMSKSFVGYIYNTLRGILPCCWLQVTDV